MDGWMMVLRIGCVSGARVFFSTAVRFYSCFVCSGEIVNVVVVAFGGLIRL